MSSPIKTGLLAIGALVLALQDKHLQNRLDTETFTAEIKAITDKVDELQALPTVEAVEGATLDLQPYQDALDHISESQDEILAALRTEAEARADRDQKLDEAMADLKPILNAIAKRLDSLPDAGADQAKTEAAGDLIGDGKGKGKSESKAA